MNLEKEIDALFRGLVRLVWFLVVLAIGGSLAYLLWPEGITDIPLGELTLGVLARLGSSFVVGYVTIGLAFSVFE